MVTTNQNSIIEHRQKKRERNPNITLKIVIKSQGKSAKERGASGKRNKVTTITTFSELWQFESNQD